MKNSKKTSRRSFMIDSAAAAMFLPAVDTVFASLLKSAVMPSTAQAAAPFKSFIHLNLYAAPPRWMYDLFLNPKNEETKFIASKQVTNRYIGDANKYTNSRYDLYNHAASGYHVPYLWSLDVPRAGSGTVKAHTLLNNMLNIRGINVLNAAHNGAAELHQTAIIGSPTISSLTADNAVLQASNPTQNLIRSIALNGGIGNKFRSSKGLSQFAYNVNSNNDLANMFQAFQPISVANGFNATFVNNRAALQDKVNTALNSLSPVALRYYQNILDSSKASMKILSGSTVDTFTQLSTEWTDLFGKYKSIIDRTIDATYPGINDKKIGTTYSGNPERALYQYGQDLYMQNKVSGNVDLRDMMANTHGDLLAAQFAVTEFMATRKLCPSINVTVRPFQMIRMNTTMQGTMTFDQHHTGAMVGVQLNTLYFLALTGCVLELIDALKDANVFNDTLIYMASEFNRSARIDGSGADHGSMAAHISLLSGRINKFKIIGNIYKDSAGTNVPYAANYKGTWGVGAPFVDNVNLNIIQVWASIMRTLGMSVPDIPNAVKKNRLIFTEVGSLSVSSLYNKVPQNVINQSR